MDNESKRMTEEEYQRLSVKIEKEWPLRCQLATLAGFKANPKNPRALIDTEFDKDFAGLYLEVLFRQPQNAGLALILIRDCYK